MFVPPFRHQRSRRSRILTQRTQRMGFTLGLAAQATAHVTGTRARRTAAAGPVCPGVRSAAAAPARSSQAPTDGGPLMRFPVACVAYAGVRDARPHVVHAYGCPEGLRCACATQGGAADGGGAGAGAAGADTRRTRQELPGGDEHVRGPHPRRSRSHLISPAATPRAAAQWRLCYDLRGPQQPSTRISCSLVVPRSYNQPEPYNRG
jgi:hypothetical protein